MGTKSVEKKEHLTAAPMAKTTAERWEPKKAGPKEYPTAGLSAAMRA